ncbi:phosphoribosylformylglycinamidine cyclo-ligase [Proteiniclasticum ruminis]|uniref:Phosphoribosylformylglycinamidine cyclo-ligase n=1 Tax=Proteiniclasticum ruminis TaxID=398199 RepID=A0A1I4XXT4_9CLOT|nr:phosphoribosylformylglycinamidine cyclo-ligase [Proteiniclasticum ruminis]SFN30597.1 phosphoribosylformylglycinamidine cyclo-ligase [Proteiniclasticum ruminis]
MMDYKSSGVNIEEGYRSVEKIKGYAKKTLSPLVLNGLGSFAGMMELPEGYRKPVLVSGTDGVGTKLRIALDLKKYDTVGIDCVAMCVNDILCHGAKPLFFLDYIACGKLDADVSSELVKGIAEGCIQGAMSLIGGETAEMPGFYEEGDYDMAGFAVGVCEKDQIITGETIESGDVLIGLPSSGFHSNGFSLLRKVFPDFQEIIHEERIGDLLLTPTRIYTSIVMKALAHFEIKGMAHITGGGFIENLPRITQKEHLRLNVYKDSYSLPDIYDVLASRGVDRESFYKTFNTGIGYVFCVSYAFKESFLEFLKAEGEEPVLLGYVDEGDEELCFR